MDAKQSKKMRTWENNVKAEVVINSYIAKLGRFKDQALADCDEIKKMMEVDEDEPLSDQEKYAYLAGYGFAMAVALTEIGEMFTQAKAVYSEKFSHDKRL
jgi:hypothetical protein